MGRIVRKITLGKKKVLALFDTGAERSYITRGVLPAGAKCSRIEPVDVAMGGEVIRFAERCLVNGEIDGLPFDFNPHLGEKPFMIDNKRVDVLIGAAMMEEWNITIDPKNKSLNLSGLKKRSFVEL